MYIDVCPHDILPSEFPFVTRPSFLRSGGRQVPPGLLGFYHKADNGNYEQTEENYKDKEQGCSVGYR